jgi:hypothetical protein
MFIIDQFDCKDAPEAVEHNEQVRRTDVDSLKIAVTKFHVNFGIDVADRWRRGLRFVYHRYLVAPLVTAVILDSSSNDRSSNFSPCFLRRADNR